MVISVNQHNYVCHILDGVELAVRRIDAFSNRTRCYYDGILALGLNGDTIFDACHTSQVDVHNVRTVDLLNIGSGDRTHHLSYVACSGDTETKTFF